MFLINANVLDDKFCLRKAEIEEIVGRLNAAKGAGA